jgi:hypothetical protein
MVARMMGGQKMMQVGSNTCMSFIQLAAHCQYCITCVMYTAVAVCIVAIMEGSPCHSTMIAAWFGLVCPYHQLWWWFLYTIAIVRCIWKAIKVMFGSNTLSALHKCEMMLLCDTVIGAQCCGNRRKIEIRNLQKTRNWNTGRVEWWAPAVTRQHRYQSATRFGRSYYDEEVGMIGVDSVVMNEAEDGKNQMINVAIEKNG